MNMQVAVVFTRPIVLFNQSRFSYLIYVFNQFLFTKHYEQWTQKNKTVGHFFFRFSSDVFLIIFMNIKCQWDCRPISEKMWFNFAVIMTLIRPTRNSYPKEQHKFKICFRYNFDNPVSSLLQIWTTLIAVVAYLTRNSKLL